MRPLLTLILVMIALTGSAQDWKLVKEKEGIQVYTRMEEGRRLKDVRIVTTIDATLHELVAALEDFSSPQSWVKNTVASYKVEERSPSNFIFYTATEFPFPASDRDVVIEALRSQDSLSRTVRIDYNAVSGSVEKKEGYVRMPELNAHYTLTPVGDDKVAVDYYLRADIGGSIPDWIINLAISIGPTDTMMALRAVLDTGKYSDAVVPQLH